MTRPREVDGFPGLRVLRADNPSPLTLDGTRTHLLGRERCIVVDPGPDLDAHLDALDGAMTAAESVTIALTHDHPDHHAGAEPLASRLLARGLEVDVRGHSRGTLEEGDALDSDAGRLVALSTPGHTRDHMAFFWPGEGLVFCGDLMTGGLDTALVAPPEGHLGDYLASLRRIAALAPRAIVPAHGPPFTTSPGGAIATYLEHRRTRLEQVRTALEDGETDEAMITRRVYGDALPPALRPAAEASVRGYLEYLREERER